MGGVEGYTLMFLVGAGSYILDDSSFSSLIVTMSL